MTEQAMNLVMWIAGGAGALVLLLLGVFVAQNGALFKKFEGLSAQVAKTRADLERLFSASIQDLQLQLAHNYVRSDDCSRQMERNAAGHSDQWEKINEAREQLSKIEGRIASTGGPNG